MRNATTTEIESGNSAPAKARTEKHLCQCCGRERAVFFFRGRIRRDDQHDLCPRCYRAECNRQQAIVLSLSEAA